MYLKKALYGHPDSGTFWDNHSQEALIKAGVVPVADWPSCYTHPRLGLLLVCYADDFKLAGPKENLAEGWKFIRKKILTEDPKPSQLFLGCEHEHSTVTLPSGVTARCVTYNMESFLASSAKLYRELAASEGWTQALTKASTPFCNEDHASSPQGKPCGSGPSVCCPWCRHSFPFSGQANVKPCAAEPDYALPATD